MIHEPSKSATGTDPESGDIKSLLQDLSSEAGLLLQKEMHLARVELAEKAAALGRHAASVGIGAAIAYAGLIVLLFGLGDAIAAWLRAGGTDPEIALWVGRIGVGFVVALIGWILFARARRALKSDSLVPDRTIQTLREDARWLKSKLHRSHEPI
jgi:hypothetical protein